MYQDDAKYRRGGISAIPGKVNNQQTLYFIQLIFLKFF